MRRLLIALAALLAAGCIMAQHLRRTDPSRRRAATRHSVAAAVAYDTVTAPPADSVAVAGFEKPLRAMRESMFVTNSSSRDITGVGLDIVYTDLSGRMLHRAAHDVDVIIPAGETRRVEVPSFDSSGLLYYRLSPKPRNTRQATPFDVKVTVTYITCPFLTPANPTEQ